MIYFPYVHVYVALAFIPLFILITKVINIIFEESIKNSQKYSNERLLTNFSRNRITKFFCGYFIFYILTLEFLYYNNMYIDIISLPVVIPLFFYILFFISSFSAKESYLSYSKNIFYIMECYKYIFNKRTYKRLLEHYVIVEFSIFSLKELRTQQIYKDNFNIDDTIKLFENYLNILDISKLNIANIDDVIVKNLNSLADKKLLTSKEEDYIMYFNHNDYKPEHLQNFLTTVDTITLNIKNDLNELGIDINKL